MDIDSLAHGLDRLTSTVDYRAAIECLDAACRSESGHIEAQFDKIATKLLASVSKMMESRADFHPYGLLMIKAIVCNCSKSVRVSNHTIIMRLTETYLCHSAAEGCVDELEVSEAATFTLAVLHSTEGAAAWGRIFQRYVDGCLALLSVQLGVETTASAGGSKGAVDKFHFSNLPQTVAMSSLDLSSAYGPRKAYVVSRLFSGYCRVLQRMLATGCSTGPVVVPMPGFLELCHVCLHTISSPRHVSAHVAKNQIQNAVGGVSVLDVAGIAVALKGSCMEVVDALLSAPNPLLFRIADVLCRYIHHCLVSEAAGDGDGSADAKVAAREYRKLFAISSSCFIKALSCFPPSLVGKRSVQGIISFMLVQFRYLVRNVLLAPVGAAQVAQPQYQDSRFDFVATTPMLQRLLFAVLRSLLLRCGVLLSQPDRSMVQTEIILALSALNKGLVSIAGVGGVRRGEPVPKKEGSDGGGGGGGLPSHDRKAVNRCTGYEAVRADTVLQCLLIQLATTELLVPPGAQGSATNSNSIGLLRSVCTLCKRSTRAVSSGNNRFDFGVSSHGAVGSDHTVMELLTQVTCAEMQLDVLLHPTAVALPSRPLAHMAQEFLCSYNSTVTRPTAPDAADADADAADADAVDMDISSSTATAASNSISSASGAGKRKFEELSNIPLKQQTQNQNQIQNQDSKEMIFGYNGGSGSGSGSLVNTRSGLDKEDQEEDDDELPDIDLS